MKTLPAQQMAVHEADTSRKAHESSRESFERHVKPDRSEADEGAARANRPDLASAVKPGIDATPRDPATVVNRMPLTPTDALFGSGSRIYPEGLAVIGYLSMLATGPGLSAGGQAALSASGAAVATSIPPPSSPSFAVAVAIEQGDVTGQTSAPVIAQLAASRAEGMDDAPDAAPAATGAAELPTWLSRRVFFAGQGASTTLRLRDYRIADASDRQLIDQLLGFASGQGRPVGRIVINGREVWRRDDMDTHINEQGVTRHGS